ncbi:type II toxin-antitoxin system VapC family toxin [Vibrio parahaemolyticus]|uniref:type II toxin-antitoxin system VapC family toxin n=1 Tax=Vibrio parahaemolyticus TaxID=670 RepID=UPI001E437FDA|nr:type II toxin-antitoxin system VapC family toxin [Vibrio parahaemolyticus]MCX8905307.1 type II toxin-antitoxin system VapC family toxin [Vibrio parahaemolyticus]MCZ6338362.1 type II toxin-antitoxin system VapC family toxin [Vibrio parahaemolyticus]MCZ6358207.1 type II toxin-antitoxin system VapC family toxin [Vibrio parahaemolyticus]
MSKKNTYMLDTCICSFIMREQPITVLEKLQAVVSKQNRIVISAITYQEMQYGLLGKKASPKHAVLVAEFLKRVDEILPWDKAAVDATIKVKQSLMASGTPIGNNDSAIAGHAIAAGCILVTNNTREFSRVADLKLEDWVH